MVLAQNTPPVFSGEFRHALDSKNRITIPSRWRTSDADEFFLIVDRSAAFARLMPPDQFRQVGERLANNPDVAPRDRAVFLRHFYSRSVQLVADKQGRMTIPEDVGRRLELDGEAVLVGAHQTFELWSSKAWAVTQQSENSIFERVADLVGL